MKLVLSIAVALTLTAGCKPSADGSGSGAPGAAANATNGASSAKPAGPAAAPASTSFFAGEAPPGVKMKPTKSFAMDPGILMIQGVEGWTGGQLPGYEHMAMSKDTTAVARVTTSSGVTGEMNCKDIAVAAAMAPLRAKNLKESAPAVLRQVGKNKFVAREGACTADGPKGPVEIHFLNILRKDKGSFWHYAVLVGYPPTAPQELKNEAMAWARSLEYNGQNGFTMP